jgi:hypothetical protein
MSSIGSELIVVYYTIQNTINERSLSEISIADYTRHREHWSGIFGGMRVITARAFLGFHLEVQPKRRQMFRRPDPKHMDVTICFCKEFALDDDEEEVVRKRVLKQETVANEHM